MKVIKAIVFTILLIVIIPVLLISIMTLWNSYTHPNEIPSFLGWKPFIVVSNSMKDVIMDGDIVVVKEVDPDTVEVGDIIAFRQRNSITTHRISRIENKNERKVIYTKGDANQKEDPWEVYPEQIEGIYKFKISGLGNVAIFVQTPTGIGACLSIPLTILIVMQFVGMIRDAKNSKFEESENERLRKEIEELKKKLEKKNKKKL